MTKDKDRTPVAQDIITMCTKCKMELNHIVLVHNADGIVEKVKCHTCGSKHKYRPDKKKAAKKTTKKRSRAKIVDPAMEFEKLAEKLKEKEPVPYSMSGSFKNDDVIEHKTFGRGIVIGVSFQKMEVIFSEGRRLLVTDRP